MKIYKTFFSIILVVLFLNDIEAKEGEVLPVESVKYPFILRFKPDDFTFYGLFKDNEKHISGLAFLMERYKKEIQTGEVIVRVNGYCSLYPSTNENLSVAKEICRRVKSWFILYHEMKEEYYRTYVSGKGWPGEDNFVVIAWLETSKDFANRHVAGEKAIVLPETKVTDREKPGEERKAEIPFPKASFLPAESTEYSKKKNLSIAYFERFASGLSGSSRKKEDKKNPFSEATGANVDSKWNIGTNLLYWAALLPNVQVEFSLTTCWSLHLEGEYAGWRQDKKHKCYQLAVAVPEIRYWFVRKAQFHGHYIGLYAGGGIYDIENGGTGYQGEFYIAPGLSYGYMFPLGRRLSLNLEIGAGYLRTNVKRYEPIEGCYVYRDKKRTDYIGPTKAEISLVWRMGKERRREFAR